MTTLANFPMKNQRITTLSDGSPDPNRDFDCVAESIAAGLQYYLGRNFSGGVLKEIVYGRDYTGGTAARSYVQYCAQQGIHLYPIDGPSSALTTLAHGHIKAGHPVVFTEIDPYVDVSLPQWQGATHVCIWYSEAPGSLSAMDPFIADTVTKSDQQWQDVMQYSEIWIMEKIGAQQPMAIGLSSPGVSKYYKQGSNGAWQCITPGHDFVVHGAILSFYRMVEGAGLCGLSIMGLPTSNEYSLNVPGHPEIMAQDFERVKKVTYDPQRVLDAPPGAGNVYFPHVAEADQTELHTLQSQIIDMQHKLAQIEALAK